MQTVPKAQSLQGPLMQRYQKLAAELSLWLSIGGFQVVKLPFPCELFLASIGRPLLISATFLIRDGRKHIVTFTFIHLDVLKIPARLARPQSSSNIHLILEWDRDSSGACNLTG